MTILDEDAADGAPSRHQMRLDRQARVGILRNLREPPRLPPRKAPLTGKWMDLRSARRLHRQGLEPVAGADGQAPRTVEHPGGRDAATAEVQTAGAEGLAPRGAGDRRAARFLAGVLAGLVLAALAAVVAAVIFAPAG